MCGFLVELNIGGRSITSKPHFLDLLSKSRMRGPDSQGWFSNGSNLQFGFNRLAILELSAAGEQPMHSHNARYTLVFNGEIYNHLELRQQLDYISFKGHSDTETIVACFVEWGVIDTIKKLNGMFSMVVYDKDLDEIHLVRDFAGIKPLFYGWDGHTLVAASQYDQIFSHPSFIEKSVDPQVLKLYLEQHFTPAPFGLYTDTYQVNPGEIITFTKKGKYNKTRYWELPKTSIYSITERKEASQYISDKLSQSVGSQLLSDVPLGAFLSGGVDSSLITSYIRDYTKNPQVFTIGSDSQKHDESARAQQFAEAMELQQQIWQLSATEALSYWDEAMASLHEPFADFSILPTYLVSKLAKKKVTVSLSGDGGDELFFGYERFWSIGKNISYQHYPEIFRKILYGIDKYATGNKRLNSVLLAPSQGKAQQGLHSRFRKNWLHEIAPDLQDIELPKSYGVYQYSNTRDIRQLLCNMRYSEFYGMMQKSLRKVDLASMQNSLEVRVPILDKNVIEASLQIDPLLSYGKGKQKQLLKELLNSRIPAVAEEKVKKGFSVPLTDWLRQDLREKVSEHLLDADLSRFGFEKKNVEKMLSSHFHKNEDLKWPIFTLYALTKFR